MAIAMPYLNFFSILFYSQRMQGPVDDLVLDTHVQFGEEGAETGHPDHQVAVFFRVFLCIPEDLGVQHIELDMIATIIEQCLDQMQHIVPAFAGFELIRRKLHVHVRGTPFHCIIAFGCRHHQCGRTVDIGSRHGRETSVGERHPGFLAVRQRACCHTHRVVDTLGILVERGLDVLADIVATAIHIVERLQNAVVHPVEEPVHFRDIVAVLGRFKAHLPDFLIFSLEVGRQCFPQFGHSNLLVVEHQFLHCHQRVGCINAANADLGNRVVVGPTVPDFSAGLNAASGQDGAPGDRHDFSVQHACNPCAPAEGIFTELKLLLKSCV